MNALAANEIWGVDSVGFHDRLKAARFSTREKARAECARVIAETEAMVS